MSESEERNLPVLERVFVARAIDDPTWEIGNRALYALCQEFPRHERAPEILAKVWLIGRSYAAAIERGQQSDQLGDDFYTEVVAPQVLASGIDEWLDDLRAKPPEAHEAILRVHRQVMQLFSEMSGLNQRSLASKYLHFHLPEHFYIFDSRAENIVKFFTRGKAIPFVPGVTQDQQYGDFVSRCNVLAQEVAGLLGRAVTRRELDKVALAYANAQAPHRFRGPTDPIPADRFRAVPDCAACVCCQSSDQSQ
jgi:hypothetical protein